MHIKRILHLAQANDYHTSHRQHLETQLNIYTTLYRVYYKGQQQDVSLQRNAKREGADSKVYTLHCIW